MRFFSFLIAALFAAGAGAAALAQPPAAKKADTSDKEKEVKKDFNTITEINGKTLDQWIKDLHSTDSSDSVQALKTILLFGPDRAQKALPDINEKLKKHKVASPVDASFRVNAISTLTSILTGAKKVDVKQGEESLKLIIAMLKDQQIAIRHRAIQAMTYFGPAARSAIEQLVKLTKDLPTFETRQAAVTALGFVARPLDKDGKYTEKSKEKGPSTEVTHALYDRLKPTIEKASAVRLAAIQALSVLQVGKSSQKPAFELHMDPVAFKDPRPLVRIAAHLSLYDINKLKSKMRRAALAKLLDYPESLVRIEAARGLGMIGADSKDQLTPLIRSINDKEQSVGAAAIWAIGRVGETSREARATLANLLLNDKLDPAVRIEAAKGLAVSGEAAADMIPALLRAAKAPKEEDAVKFTAIITLANMGQVALTAVPDLQVIGADLKEPEAIREAAKKAADHIQKAKTKEAPKKGAAR